MTTHQGHVEIDGVRHGATLLIDPGSITVEIVGESDPPGPPERLESVRLLSSTGYFTLLDLFRRNFSLRFGVGSLATYSCRLAIENGNFEVAEDIRSRTWVVHLGDVARVVHVNGVESELEFLNGGKSIGTWTARQADPVRIDCPTAGLSLEFRQSVHHSGDRFDGFRLQLRYPIVVTFDEEKQLDVALKELLRIRIFFSMLMGRVLPVLEAAARFEGENGPHDMTIHGIRQGKTLDYPQECLLANRNPAELARLLANWLNRYDAIEDAIRLHVNALGQRSLAPEMRFQIFVQALEGLHRRTGAKGTPIDLPPVLEALRKKGIEEDVVLRVEGILASSHEPSLRLRLEEVWSKISLELAAMRPGIDAKKFVRRVVATRNHYAHRTDLRRDVLQSVDLWNATELIKAISHMAILIEIGADVKGMGLAMVSWRFVEFGTEM